MVFVFLGHMSKAPEPDLLEKLGEPDVVIMPVGEHFLPEDAAAKLARQLEPAFVIPSFAKNFAPFLKAAGAKSDPQDKLVFKKKDTETEKMEVVALKAQ